MTTTEHDETVRFRAALEEIVSTDISRTWTATNDNPESHWELYYGQYARIALKALGREIPQYIREGT